jgi:endonuclease/exonuclease/phosphatase family metal-dependent hydrolase
VKSGWRALLLIAFVVLASTVSGCEFWQYNIANGNPAGPPQNHGQDEVISRIRNQGARPIAMSLNEVCGQSINQLQSALGGYGYQVVFNKLDPSGCGGPGYGDAIMHLGNRVGFPGHPNGILRSGFSTNDQPHHVGAMAVGIDVGGRRMLVWTTHLEAGSDSAASAQAFELLQSVHYWQEQTGWPAVVGGDFNLTPNQFPMNQWCSDYQDPMHCSTAYPTNWSAGKIDYMFSSFGWNGGYFLSQTYSDHYGVVGIF